MTNQHISVSYGRTIDVGNYESVKLNASSGGDLEPGEDKQEAYTKLWKEVRGQVRVRVSKIRRVAGED